MRTLKLSKSLKRDLAEAYGNTLIKVAKDTMSSSELDSVLLAMFNFFSDIANLDYEMIQDIEESIEVLEDKKLNKIEIELNRRLQKMKLTEYEEKRLMKHFNEPSSYRSSLDERVKRIEDTEFEVNEKYEYHLLIAIRNSFIAEQSDINRIKSIAKDTSLTEAIKKVIPKKEHSKVKNLVKVQNNRYRDYQEAQARLI